MSSGKSHSALDREVRWEGGIGASSCGQAGECIFSSGKCGSGFSPGALTVPKAELHLRVQWLCSRSLWLEQWAHRPTWAAHKGNTAPFEKWSLILHKIFQTRSMKKKAVPVPSGGGNWWPQHCLPGGAAADRSVATKSGSDHWLLKTEVCSNEKK